MHVRNAIAMGEQVKKYMIAQQQLMQNPYYTMLAKKDVAGLSNEELEKKANTVQNPVLADYYRKVLNVRNSGFERSKGMDAAYANAAKLVEDGKDNVEELLKTGKKAVEQKQKKDNEDKFVKRARMAEEARIKREANKKDAKVQATIKKYREAHITEYNKKVEEQNREIEAQDPEFAEYKILNSYDVWEKIQENPPL